MNRVILITGSTSGIGLGIARRFAANGDSISFHGLEPNGEEIALSIGREFDVPVFYSRADLLEVGSIETLINETRSRLGPIDVLVNNAGIQHVSAIEDFPIAQWDHIVGVNLNAAFHTTRLVLLEMKKEKGGRIINIASVHGLVASEFKAAYVSAKHGLIGLTKATALEGAPHGITANAICPGYVDTPLVRDQITSLARAHRMSEGDVIEKIMLAKQPVKKFVTTDSIGALCVFLASGEAELITGAAIPVDGGWSAQ